MATKWSEERWIDRGVNEAGDRVYESNRGASGSGGAATSSSQMTKAELQQLAEARGLPTSGSKQELLDRLSGVGS